MNEAQATALFDILYVDPPWRYAARNNTSTKFGGGAMAHYPTMTTDELIELGAAAGSLAADNSLCFMWATGPKIPDALRVMNAWGFKFATVGFVWIKLTKLLKIFAGPGNYTGANAEFVLVGRRGSMLQIAKRLVPSVVMSIRERHSQKPEEVAARIDLMYPDARKLEMFARRADRPGWWFHGFEIGDGVRLAA